MYDSNKQYVYMNSKDLSGDSYTLHTCNIPLHVTYVTQRECCLLLYWAKAVTYVTRTTSERPLDSWQKKRFLLACGDRAHTHNTCVTCVTYVTSVPCVRRQSAQSRHVCNVCNVCASTEPTPKIFM